MLRAAVLLNEHRNAWYIWNIIRLSLISEINKTVVMIMSNINYMYKQYVLAVLEISYYVEKWYRLIYFSKALT